MFQEKLCDSSKSSCYLRLCVIWDNGFNTSDDEILNSRREKDQDNYFVWIKMFCENIDCEIADTLSFMMRKGMCLSCLGREMYSYLRFEYMRPYLRPQIDYDELYMSPDFPYNLTEAEGREDQETNNESINWMTHLLFQVVKQQCLRSYYERIAILLNHGCSFRCDLYGGVFAACRFHDIKDEYGVTYSEKLLRTRVKRANPSKALQGALNRFSPMGLSEHKSYMCSKNGTLYEHFTSIWR